MQTATYIYAVEQDERLAHVPSEPYVIVVDDDASILSVVSFLLDTENYPHMSFSDSSNVIPFLEKIYSLNIRLPSLLLLDLMMPALSGYDIAASLAQNSQLSTIPILVMTADHRVKEVSNVPGASDLINKPFHIDALLDKIEHFLAQ